MRTSNDGIELIKGFESFEPRPYRCPAGKLTIGYGHVIGRVDESLSRTVLTEEAADSLLRKDLLWAETALNRQALPLTQWQYDALVSFIFNVGVGAFIHSTLLKKLKAGDFKGAADEFLRWDHAAGKKLAGLTRRRQAERTLFLKGIDHDQTARPA